MSFPPPRAPPTRRCGCRSRRTPSTRLLPMAAEQVRGYYRVSCYPRAHAMVRFQRQPPGTALTRTSSFIGMGCAVVAAVLIVDEEPVRAGMVSALSGGLLLLGGHRANHGLGGPVDRMLT